jgi:hypothetical protein
MASNQGPVPMPQVLRPANPNTQKQRPKKTAENAPYDHHAQRWAEYEKYGKEPAPPPEKVKIALRIGLFFDGTGNNASNSALGALCGAHHPVQQDDLDASCKPYMADPDSSYGNDESNVKKLSELYRETLSLQSDGRHQSLYMRLYIDGIGTKAGGKDSLVGSGTGRGDTGIESRVQETFGLIKRLVSDIIKGNPDCEISSLTFDAFGFSRGAAAARHFANEVVLGKRGPLGPALLDNAKAFSRSFADQYQRDINMGFIGLFDTVASVAGLTNLGNVSSSIAPGIKLHLASRYFSNVVHLVARDELRANFALSTVSPDHREITLPGVHSDIGGGYLAEAEECVLVSPMQALTVRQGTDVKTTSIYRDAAQAKTRMVAEGWPASVLEIVTPAPKLLPVDSQDRMAPREQRVYAGLQLKRPVKGELSRVYLRVMYALAKQNGVPFDDIPDLPEYRMPTELQPLCDRFVGGDYSTTAADEAILKGRYIHTSGHWNNPLGKRTPSSLKLVYINAPSADGVRLQHPHVPDWKLW